MEINAVREKICASEYVGHENVIEIVEGDIIVPDIKPDILSLNKVDGNVYITRKDIQDGHVKIDGTIDVYAMYTADDEKNSIKGINAMLNFSEDINMPDAQNGMMIDANYSLGNIEYKVINGRKISVKCPIDISVFVKRNTDIDVVKTIENNDKIQMQNQLLTFNQLVVSGNENVSVKENISLNENNNPIGEILKVSTSIEDKDFKISYNKVLAKGELKVHIVYVADNDESSIETFETKIPIAGFIDMPGVNDNMNVDVNYDVSYLYVKPIYQDLRANSFYVESEVRLNANAYENHEVEIVNDIYNPECEIKYDISNINISGLKSYNDQIVNLTQSLTIPELSDSKVLDVSVTPVINDKKYLDDKIIIDGNSEIDITYYNNIKNTLGNKRIDLPFQQTLMKDKNLKLSNETFSVSLEHLEYDLQTSGQLQLKILLRVEAKGIEDIIFNAIDNIEQTDNIIEPVASIVIYFVKTGDSLWKIAKKYRTTVEDIIKANGLKDDKIYPEQKLLIPKKIYRIKIDSI